MEDNLGWRFLTGRCAPDEIYEWSDGSSDYDGDDGSRGYINSDGSGSYNGADGSWGYIDSDGSGSYYGADGSWGVMDADGSCWYYGADSELIELYYREDESYYSGEEDSDDEDESRDPSDSASDSEPNITLTRGHLPDIPAGVALLGVVGLAAAMFNRLKERRLRIKRERRQKRALNREAKIKAKVIRRKMAEHKRRKAEEHRQLICQRITRRAAHARRLLSRDKNIAVPRALSSQNAFDAREALLDAGFVRVRMAAVRDITWGNEPPLHSVERIIIDGSDGYEPGGRAPYNAPVIIRYNDKVRIRVPFSARRLVHRHLDYVSAKFLNLGLKNIEVVEDALPPGAFALPCAVTRINIDGQPFVKRSCAYPYDAKVTIAFGQRTRKK